MHIERSAGVCVCVGGGGGGTLIFSYIRRFGPFFGCKILNFNIFFYFFLLLFFFLGGGGGQKNEYFWGYYYLEILWIFLGGSHKN